MIAVCHYYNTYRCINKVSGNNKEIKFVSPTQTLYSLFSGSGTDSHHVITHNQ